MVEKYLAPPSTWHLVLPWHSGGGSPRTYARHHSFSGLLQVLFDFHQVIWRDPSMTLGHWDIVTGGDTVLNGRSTT